MKAGGGGRGWGSRFKKGLGRVMGVMGGLWQSLAVLGSIQDTHSAKKPVLRRSASSVGYIEGNYIGMQCLGFAMLRTYKSNAKLCATLMGMEVVVCYSCTTECVT